MHQINATQDAKAVAEIQARIAVEQATIANEATKLQLVAMLEQAEERLQEEQREEVGAARRTGQPLRNAAGVDVLVHGQYGIGW